MVWKLIACEAANGSVINVGYPFFSFFWVGEGDRKKKMEELEEYQRKFRNLESDRKAYAEETVALIKK